MGILINAAAGLIFGIGLVISGMANPAKVLNFLDLAGTWDPSLAFVMAGAVAVAFLGYRIAGRRAAPVLEPSFPAPPRSQIDRRLVLGSAVFGVGWGLTGFCPGPAIVSLPLLNPSTGVFVIGLVAGIAAAVGASGWRAGATSRGSATAEG